MPVGEMPLRVASIQAPAWAAKMRCGAALLFFSSAGVHAGETENITVIGQTGLAIDQPGSQLALSGEALRRNGIVDIFDLGQVVPGLRVDRYGVSTQPTLRGIGGQNVQG